jgi:hypothetical protein
MAKKNMYASVAISGKAWDYRVPAYLAGKLEAGDIVVVSDDDGGLAFGKVERLMPTTSHRKRNVRTIVDRVRVKRYLKAVGAEKARGELMADMAERLAELDALAAYEKAAGADEAMAEMLEAYKGL